MEDSEENKTPLWTCEVEYEQEDRLFMTRLQKESTTTDLHATSMISQKLAEGARQSSETQREPFTSPDCAKGFESIFSKKDFDILLEHRQWDHAIELILGSEPRLLKVYCKGDRSRRLQEIPQLIIIYEIWLQPTSRRFLRELDEAPGGNNLHYIL